MLSFNRNNKLQTVTEGRLGWGEVTPLWFLAEERGTSGTRRRVLPQVTSDVMSRYYVTLRHVTSRYVTLCHVMSRYITLCHAQDLLVLTSPRPRGPDTELADLLDHCVTVGEETGDILEQFEQRVVLVSAHWSTHRHVTSCRPLIGPDTVT